MPERIPTGIAIRVPIQAYLASDHISPATGKTIAVTISKNGAAYGNPSGGATNATEIGSGSYYVDLSTTDTGTAGPLFVKGAEGTIDTAIAIYNVVNAHNAGFDALPNAAAEASGGLYTRGTGAGQINQANNGQIDANAARTGGTTNTGRDLGASVLLSSGTGTGQLKLASGYVAMTWADIAAPSSSVNLSGTTVKAVTDGVTISGTPDVNLAEIGGDNTFIGTLNQYLTDYNDGALNTGIDGSISGDLGGKVLGGGAGTISAVGAWALNDAGAAVAPASTALSSATWTNAKAAFLTGDAFARLGAPAGASTAADIAAIQAKTTNLPASPAAVGSLMGLADGAITDAKVTFPAESAGRPTTFLAAMRRVWEWTVNKRIRTRSTGVVQLRNAADGADLETQTQSTTGSVGSEVDTQTKGA